MNTQSVHPRSRRARRLRRAEVTRGKLLALPVVGGVRPTTRGDCALGPRPCPWESCKFHLYLDVSPETGSIKFNFPDVAPGDLGRLAETCALDVADGGGVSLDAIGQLMNLTGERARQLAASGFEWFERAFPEGADDDTSDGGDR